MREQKLKFDRPVIGLDLETTGVDPAKDRIITIGLVVFSEFPGGSPEAMIHKEVNPGIPIPPEATAVHGYTDEKVKDFPPLSKYAKSIFRLLDGADLVGFNISNFDVPLLHEELARNGIAWDVGEMRIFDAGTIFTKQNPRDLTAAVKHYLEIDFTSEAHNSLRDAAVTLDVFRAQIEKHKELGEMNAEELAAHSLFGPRIDLAGKIAMAEDGTPIYAFGKSKGIPVLDDPGFGDWMLRQDWITTNTKQVVRDILDSAGH